MTAALLAGIFSTQGPLSPQVELTVQIGYGSFAGGLLVALELFVLRVIAIPPTTREAFSLALAWSTLLFLGATIFGRFTMSKFDSRLHLRELLGYHLIYGLGLGIWIRMTWIT